MMTQENASICGPICVFHSDFLVQVRDTNIYLLSDASGKSGC